MFKNLFLFLSLLSIISYSIAIEWPYRDCAKNEIKALRVEPCARSPCSFQAGDKVNVTVEFIANQNTDSVKLYGTLKTGGLFGFQVPYTGMDENACNSGRNTNKLDCPLQKGQTYKFVMTQTVPQYSRFNIFRYTVWKLVGRYGADLTCAEFDIYQDVALNRYFSQFAE